MKTLILAAGYAKRLYPHIRNIPKPLLPVAGKPIVELILSKIGEVNEIEEVLIVTNELYLQSFDQWKEGFKYSKEIKIISDGTKSNQERKGAIGDLHFIVEREQINTELLAIIALHDLKDPKKLSKRFGVIELGKNNKIVGLKEKPEKPKTSLASTLCYILTQRELKKLKEYLKKSQKVDDAGSFIKYLLDNDHEIYGYTFTERWYDIGSYEQYRELNQTELKKRLEADSEFNQSIEAIIFFADVIGSATISEYTSKEDYDAFICEFQEISLKIIKKNLERYGYDEEDRAFCEYSVRGDEAVFILYTKNRERDVKTAISTAIELKREFFLSKFNKNRKGKSFYDVGIGIHYGDVVLKQHPNIRETNKRFNAEGYAINLTKRIEGYSRNGKFSKIMLSKKISDIISLSIILSERIDVPLVGIYGSCPIYELQVYGDIEDPEYAPQVTPLDIDYYVAALESSPHDMWLLLTVARYYYDEEDYLTTQKYYREAIERYPNFIAGYTYLGRSLYRQNKFREAKQYLMKACELDPLSPRANNFLAITLRRLGEYDLAFQHHENATKFEPNSPYEYNSFAYTIAEAYPNILDKNQHNLKKAHKYLERAEELFDDKKDKYLYLLEHTRGLIYLKEKSFKEVITCFKKAIKSIGNNQEMMPKKREEKRLEVFYHLGVAYYEKEKDDWRQALKYFEQSLQSPEIEAGERIAYYWFKDSKDKIIDIKR
jgi:glucose-1-phosphate thymidylyltransferase